MSVNSNIRARRDEVCVSARFTGRSQSLGFPFAIEPRAIEVTLGCVVWRRDEINPATGLVDALDREQIIAPGCYASHILAVSRNRKHMPPAVALARPQEALASLDPLDVAARETFLVPIDVAPRNINPGVFFLCEDRLDLPRTRIAEHHDVGVLKPIQLLNGDFI